MGGQKAFIHLQGVVCLIACFLKTTGRTVRPWRKKPVWRGRTTPPAAPDVTVHDLVNGSGGDLHSEGQNPWGFWAKQHHAVEEKRPAHHATVEL